VRVSFRSGPVIGGKLQERTGKWGKTPGQDQQMGESSRRGPASGGRLQERIRTWGRASSRNGPESGGTLSKLTIRHLVSNTLLH